MRLIDIEQIEAKELKSKGADWSTTFFVSIAAFFYFVRSSQYILRPQLFAEDGTVWLADAHNLGLKSLTMPYNAFFHSTERLFGYLVAQLPLQYAPIIFNTSAWCIFALLAFYLFSPRTKILSNNYQRIFVLLSVGLIANIDEFFFNFSNSVFLLGIIGALILISEEPKKSYARIFEKLIFAICCFTLIFSWLYLPIALVEKLKYRRKVDFYLYIAIAGSVAQILSYLLPHVQRPVVTFQALLSKFTVLEIYNQIIIPAVRFARADLTFESNARYEVAVSFFIVTLSLFAAVYVFRASNKQVRYLLLFLITMTIASLKSPLIDSLDPIKSMSVARWGDRYFIFGILGMTIILAKLSFKIRSAPVRYWFLTAFFLLGFISSWHGRSFFVEKEFQDYRQQYFEGIKQLKQGESMVVIPINPEGWQMTLNGK